MFKYLLKTLFLKHKTCTHEKITPNSMFHFCPDCGKEVNVYWVLLRCKECNSKRRAYPLLDGIYPEENFCSKCGCKEFYLEKKERLNISDYHYAIFLKEECYLLNNLEKRIQVWVEEENRWEFCKPLLLPIINKF